MAILIRDPEADRLIRQLAARTGETITEAVRTSVLERLDRVPSPEGDRARRKRRLREITDYFDGLPKQNEDLTSEEILGYNAHGGFD